MKEQLIIKTSPKIAYYIIGTTVGILFLVLGFLIIKECFEETYPHYFPLLIACCFCFLGLWLILKAFKTDVLFLYPNKLVIKSILGYHKKTIERKNIFECYEIAKSIRYHETNPNYEYNQLIIYTDKTEYKIRSDYYTGYPLIKKVLVTDPKQRKANNKKGCFYYISTVSYIFCFLLGIASLFGAYITYTSGYTSLSDKDIVKVTGTISNEIKVLETYGRGGGNTWISLIFKEYPDLTFDISNSSFYTIERNGFLSEIKSKDTITLGVDKEQYHKIILKDYTLTFRGKISYSSTITVYSVSSKNKSFLTLKDYNEAEKRKTTYRMYFLLIFGLAIVTICIVYKKK